MAKRVEQKEYTVYIGKPLPGLPRYTVFKGELPPHVVKLMREKAAVAGLIVPISRLQAARQNINKPGHIYHSLNQQL